MPLGEQAQKPLGTAGRVFVEVGVPACRQRHAETMRKPRTDHSDFAGAGDVDEVGLEALKRFGNEGQVAEIGGIEAEILFEGEGEKAARQLQRPHAAFFNESLWAVTGADTKEREIAAEGEGLKMTAGVGNPVDFMEGVGKVGHPRLACAHIS